MDSSANLFIEVPRHNEDTVGALVKILFLIIAIPYGFPKATVYQMENPLKDFYLERRLQSFSRKEPASFSIPSLGWGMPYLSV